MKKYATYEGFAHFYDLLMQDAPYEEWFAFLLDVVKEERPQAKKVLDLGCGTGRIALLLAEQGFQVTGVDLSEEMLSIASERMYESKIPPFPLFHQDMRELNLSTRFDFIYSFCDSLNYLLDEKDVVRTFMNVANHLVEGGLFLFDVHSPYKILHVYGKGPIVEEDEELAYIWVPEVEREQLSVSHHLHFFIQEEEDLYRRISEVHHQRAYSIEDLKQWLSDAGFSIVRISADFKKDEPKEDSERIFFVAKKRGCS